MSEWNRSPDESNERFDNLLAQLRQQNGGSGSNAPGSSFLTQIATQPNPYFLPTSQQQPQGYHQQPVSPPSQTPSIYNQQSRQSSAVISPGGETPQPQQRLMAPIGTSSAGPSNADRTANLLNLLKFSQPTSSPSSQTPPATFPQISPQEQSVNSSSNNRGASDLLATLMGNAQMKENKPAIQATTQNIASSSDTSSGPPANTQAFLLQLLNRPKPAQTEVKHSVEPPKPHSPVAAIGLSGTVGDLTKALAETAIGRGIEAQSGKQQQTAKKPNQGIFNYVNPFEQLAATSPRNRTPKPKSSTPTPSGPSAPAMQILKHPRHAAAEGNGDLKRKVNDTTPASSPAHSKRKLASSTSTPSPLPDGRSQIEALIGIGAAGKGKETVAEAVRDVGNQVDKQVEEAIARAEEENSQSREEDTQSQAAIEKDLQKMMDARTEPEFEVTARVAAMSIKKELDRKGNEHVLEDTLPSPVAKAVKEMVEEAAEGHVADSWESAAESPTKEDAEMAVKVYNLPLKPWISITVLPKVDPADLPQFRADGTMDVARLEKDFDQIDRTLVSPSNNFIAYSMLKGGMRVIAQQNGEDVKVFTETRDHIFNVSLSTSQDEATETVIGTGVSGTVYWATVCNEDGDVYVRRGDKLKHIFALPPIQSAGEESSGGMLKTRARKSCGHPEFFAVGRGKSIHIIWPSVITKQGYLKPGTQRIVDTEKYLSHRSLKINTGKAGKDFTFSQDDTTIVSLDKAGRVKFWDVRTLTNADRGNERYPAPEQIQPVEIKEPLMTLVTTPANEKSWPTSVLFVDKYRPYQKGGALRYLIVGMKQNHTLQLWDLSLGKPVQELHLPHEKESDAVCSVMYHPPTGMIVVGHPTRNSIYLIHLSSPRYNLPKSISQAEYAEKLVSNDSSLPKPDATAVMSGIREYSFANKGTLRSLDILVNPASAAAHLDDPSLFELYAMHSSGVSIITVKHIDLGWNKENRVIISGLAEEEGLITVESLKPITANESDAPTAPKSAPSRSAAKDSTLKDAEKPPISSNGHAVATQTPQHLAKISSSRAAAKLESPQIAPLNGGQESAASGVDKVDRKKKKKATGRGFAEAVPNAPTDAPPKAPSPPVTPRVSDVAQPSGQLETKAEPHNDIGADKTALTVAPEISPDSLIMMRRNVSSDVRDLIEGSLDQLYRRFDDDRRAQAEIADAKQEAMLRLVSSTLSTNVEKTLGNIVMDSVRKDILPAVSDVTSKAVHEQLGVKLGVHLKSSLPKELQGVLPDVLAKALQRPEVVRQLSEAVAKSVAPHVEEQFASLLKHSITPTLTAVAVQAAQKASNDINRRTEDAVISIERKSHSDSAKIDKLTKLVAGLTETVSTMAAAQSKFQEEFLKLQQAAHARLAEGEASFSGGDSGGERTSERASATLVEAPQDIPEKDDVDTVIKKMSSEMHNGALSQAIIRWLQCETGQQEIFKKYLSKYEPAFIRELTPIHWLAIGATIVQSLDDEAMYQRLDWLDVVFQCFLSEIPSMDRETLAAIPNNVGSMVTQLETFFMRVNTHQPHHPILKRIQNITSAANLVIKSAYNPVEAHRSALGGNQSQFLMR